MCGFLFALATQEQESLLLQDKRELLEDRPRFRPGAAAAAAAAAAPKYAVVTAPSSVKAATTTVVGKVFTATNS